MPRSDRAGSNVSGVAYPLALVDCRNAVTDFGSVSTDICSGGDWVVPQTAVMAALPDILDASPLTLVRWGPDAVDEVLKAVRSSFAQLRLWMDWAQEMPTRDQQRDVLVAGSIAFDAGTDFGYLFRETATGELVGGGGVHRRVGPGAVEIGYWVRSDRHNRGYATTATAALTDAAFRYLADVDRVEIHMDCANIASARVPEKLGYRLLRTVRREKLAVGHTGRGYVWERQRNEWTPSARS